MVSVTATAFSFETMAVFVCNAWLLSVCVCVSISSPSSTIFSPSFCTVSWSNQAMIKTNFTEKLTQCLKTALSPHVKYRSGSHRHFLFSLVALAFFCFYVCNITVMAAERKQSYWGTEQLDEDVHLTTDLIKWLLNLKEKKRDYVQRKHQVTPMCEETLEPCISALVLQVIKWSSLGGKFTPIN